ncbi:hypothetical protein [Algibacter mikhailovii]|uniref:hypothetical protein n=1 Tax=Algibacter mikhailovii TaxID=425498 RepID=UPI002494AB7D|nr:hypothetical protein [Algibacter mikhailovii]
MTGSPVDMACLVIYISDKRIATPYEVLRKFDGTPKQDEICLRRSLPIATERSVFLSV